MVTGSQDKTARLWSLPRAGANAWRFHKLSGIKLRAMAKEGLAMRKSLGLTNEFFVEVSLVAQTEEAFEKFEKAVQRVPEILECHLMSGQFDYLLRVAASDARDYERIHRQEIATLPRVARIETAFALREVVNRAVPPQILTGH